MTGRCSKGELAGTMGQVNQGFSTIPLTIRGSMDGGVVVFIGFNSSAVEQVMGSTVGWMIVDGEMEL